MIVARQSLGGGDVAIGDRRFQHHTLVELIDDAALMAALDDGRLANAVLDVFHTEPLPADDPLWAHPKIRITPHTSFAGGGGVTRWKELFLDNLPRYVHGERLANEVNPNDIP